MAEDFGSFEEALDFFKQKTRIPTKDYTELSHRAHDRAFMVAGAKRDDMLADFQHAITEAAKGKPYEDFLASFDKIVEKYQWQYNGGRAWRSRVIYETNLKTMRAAGRYKQMTSEPLKKAFPYWQYVHAFERVPDNPRENHKQHDGLILPADDPWFDVNYPPNGWKCSCGIRTVSNAKLARLGKTGPDTPPPIEYETITDPGTGEAVLYPKDMEWGWAYAPGKSWAKELVPRELQKGLTDQLELPGLEKLVPLKSIASAKSLPQLPDGKPDAFYLKEFLGRFGLKEGQSKLFRDKAGQVIPIAATLFEDAAGARKIKKRGRHLAMAALAEAILDPDEIWLNWEWHRGESRWFLARRYLRLDAKKGSLAAFHYLGRYWRGVTSFDASEKYIESLRKGALLYRREK